MLYAGLRSAETLNLLVTDIDLANADSPIYKHSFVTVIFRECHHDVCSLLPL